LPQVHNLPIGLLCAVISATRIWTASSLENVYPDSVPPPGAEPHARIYAAKGEYESFQICVRSSHRAIEELDVAPEALTDMIGPPEVRRVDYLAVPAASPRAYGEETARPDPLSVFEAFTLEEEQTGALWVTYYVPRECPAGLYEGRIGVYLGGRAKRYVDVTLEVFDFEVPLTPNLTAAVDLEPDAIRSFYGIAGDTLEEWKPFYDALAPWRIVYESVIPYPDTRQALDSYLEHLLYVVEKGDMPGACVGMGPKLSNALTENGSGQLATIAKALANQGWTRRAYAEPMPPLPRSHWPELIDRYRRFNETAPSIRRLMQGVPHPVLQELAEIWVIPMRFFDPIAVERLRSGLSLSARPAYPLKSMQASSMARIAAHDMPYAAVPEDACDGTLYTAWTSADVPSESAPEWLQLELDEPIATRTIRLGWRAGHEAVDPMVEVSPDGTLWTSPRVTWKHHPSDRRFAQSWSEGVFDGEKRFIAVRFLFSRTFEGVPVSVTEVELGQAPDPASIEYLSGGAQVWLDQPTTPFPSFHADAHPLEARLVPWVCWGHGLDGIFSQPLNQWPVNWKQTDTAMARTWPPAGTGELFLVYPGKNSLEPSMRLYRLRDGLEDFEYIRRVKEAGLEADLLKADTMRICRWEFFQEEIRPERLDDVRAELQELRVAMGRALTKAAKEN
jgi:hypothetical protein